MEGVKLVLREDSIIVDELTVKYFEIKRNILNFSQKTKEIIGLENISIKIKKGEIIALIGKNGAGKSTLLNTIFGKIRPTEGNLKTFGRVIMLSGINAGFDNESTGRKNIIELSKAYGVQKEEISHLVEDVIDFSELGEAIDRNYKGYSTGMKGKLGFGFITSLSPEILLIDETLGVGDTRFRTKAQERLKEFMQRSNTVLISTHSLGLAKEMCSRGIVLDKGQLIFDGDIEEAINKYVKINV
ncbi:ATP-binding cassette domain-containing protein [Euryarchaeota archaeon]|nr:ATP-binding cassette domain-containing protein [Euryarchaeota archaeon]